MSKCYVMKKKGGEYDGYYLDSYHFLIKDISGAKIYEEDELYELDDNFYWQEVTLCEGDLEKELAVYKKALVTLNFNFGVISEILVSQSKKELTNEQTRQEIIKCLDNIDFTLDEMKEKLGYDVFIKLRKELGEKYEIL